ncbi:MAG: cation-translocating P-type ATPase [Clostridiales bacterium]|nr:cation-translocating P-type ATPase [Clostridiales bacterium]
MESYHRLSVSESLAKIDSQKEGLSQKEVDIRLPQSQKMQIKDSKRQSFLSKFWAQIKELMVLVLLISGIVSIVIGIAEKTSEEIVDGAIILGIVVMNALFGVYQERKSEKAIDSLKKLTQPEASVLREGKIFKIKTNELVYGDIVCLNSGSIVPADLRLIETSNIKINEASLTGESEAVEKVAEYIYAKEVGLGDRRNMAYAGSVVENGHAKGVVVALGTETEIGKIAESLKETKKDLTPLQKNIQGVGKILTYLILLAATVTFVLEVISNPNEILQAFLTAVAISVAAIPESMPAVITIIMSLGMAKLSKQKAIVKQMHAIETLGACDVICSDKTGTITQNKMKVTDFFAFFDKNSANFDVFLKIMVLCNDAQLGENGVVGGSTEVALVEFANQYEYNKFDLEKKYLRIDEMPFNSQKKMMSTLNIVDGEKIVFVKGALDRVLVRCKYYLKNDKVEELDEKTKQKILKENQKLCNRALRVISFAYKESEVLDEEDLIFAGLCGLQDPPRPEIFEAVKSCRSAGMRPIMITGDYKDTAFAIAKEVGIAKNLNEVISGEEIDLLSDEEFLKVVEKKNIFARVSPAHKVRIVSALKERGHIVAMTGDGVNDAPSLKKADIGIGMGKTGTDVTKDVADIIVTDDNFATIVVAVKEGRKIYGNIQKTIKYLFSANMAEILALFFVTILFPGKTFLLPVQILFVNLITDSLPAIALGVEPIEKSTMLEKPRSKKDTLFSNGVGISITVLGTIQTLLTMGAYLFGMFLYNDAIAITMAFYTLNLIQLFYMFTARTKESCFKSNPFKNKFFTLSLIVGFGLLFLMMFTELGNLLQLQPLNFTCWAVVFALSISIIFIGEIYKLCEKKFLKIKEKYKK